MRSFPFQKIETFRVHLKGNLLNKEEIVSFFENFVISVDEEKVCFQDTKTALLALQKMKEKRHNNRKVFFAFSKVKKRDY